MPTIKEQKKKKMEAQVKGDLAKMEARLVATNPGVVDVLRVYGNYENALRQMNTYLGIIQPEPRFDTTDGTSVPEE